MVLLLLIIAFTMLLSESISLLYSLIFCRADCELHVCHPSSRHGVGQGLVLLWPRICLAAILCAMSSALVCVVVRVVAARPHCAAFSTYTVHNGALAIGPHDNQLAETRVDLAGKQSHANQLGLTFGANAGGGVGFELRGFLGLQSLQLAGG